MRARRFVAVVTALLTVFGIALVAPVSAAARSAPERVTFSCVGYPQPPEAGRSWGAGQTWHIRDWTATYDEVGDPQCNGTVDVVAHVDVSMGRGVVEGTCVYHLSGIAGGYTAHFSQVWAFPDLITYGKVEGSGFGALAGWQLRSELFEALDGGIAETGFIFKPGT